MEPKQVIVIRKDLNMRKGKMCAQAAHASMGVFFKKFGRTLTPTWNARYSFTVRSGEAIDLWIRGLFTKVVVSCDTLDEILDLKKQADDNNIPNCLIEDSGKTEFNGVPTFTALAIGPDEPEKIDKITGHLKLL